MVTSSVDVRAAFEDFRSRLELDTSYDAIVRQPYRAIQTFLANNIPGSRVQLIGSLQRKTRIDPIRGLEGFDIDLLVELDSFVGWVPSYAPGAISSEAAVPASRH